eukprot:CAMPEP_0201285824 /NCGR_PEP_ID=MMETSP1317-20130820/113873_1 /ASSEMBLY_ACC=CAM_ASM_000770 /TAXON_ID=187299 /ORGANISM="Undescribed Undescribed, Strain Undescribed" /LENGTH=64 /DNA_ID=CAMNT_0047611837 /DNA_START=3575 /DNA_END=3769 /DNA_ORIENTATION=+
MAALTSSGTNTSTNWSSTSSPAATSKPVKTQVVSEMAPWIVFPSTSVVAVDAVKLKAVSQTTYS